LERCVKSAGVIKILLSQSGNFKDDSFSRFMKICLDMICEVMRSVSDPQNNKYNDIFKECIGEAVTAVDILNINTTIVLEGLFYKLIRGLSSKGNYG
jgi:hypothetical protein